MTRLGHSLLCTDEAVIGGSADSGHPRGPSRL